MADALKLSRLLGKVLFDQESAFFEQSSDKGIACSNPFL
jgi:hypothetical protein